MENDFRIWKIGFFVYLYFFCTLGVFKQKKNIQNDKIESFFNIEMRSMNGHNFVGNSKLKVETVEMQMKALNFVA